MLDSQVDPARSKGLWRDRIARCRRWRPKATWLGNVAQWASAIAAGTTVALAYLVYTETLEKLGPSFELQRLRLERQELLSDVASLRRDADAIRASAAKHRQQLWDFLCRNAAREARLDAGTATGTFLDIYSSYATGSAVLAFKNMTQDGRPLAPNGRLALTAAASRMLDRQEMPVVDRERFLALIDAVISNETRILELPLGEATRRRDPAVIIPRMPNDPDPYVTAEVQIIQANRALVDGVIGRWLATCLAEGANLPR